MSPVFPEPEGWVLIPEGHYQFRLNKEPVLQKFTYKDGQGESKEGRRMIVYAIGLNENGEFPIRDNIAVFEPRYRELCEALKVEHGKDIQVSGAVFEADVKHDASKTDPTKTFPRLVNITSKDDDLPF
jgi:hypothetical protein